MATFRNLALPQTGGLIRRAGGVSPELPNGAPLRLLSIVIPAHNEEGCICSTIEHLHLELRLRNVPHEIVAVDDGSTDSTWQKLLELREHIPVLRPVQN
jgi:dolichol-phosphate mannosyltransferase